jgi:hypothetical protein
MVEMMMRMRRRRHRHRQRLVLVLVLLVLAGRLLQRRALPTPRAPRRMGPSPVAQAATIPAEATAAPGTQTL